MAKTQIEEYGYAPFDLQKGQQWGNKIVDEQEGKD